MFFSSSFLYYGPDECYKTDSDALPRFTSVSSSKSVTFHSGIDSISPSSPSVSGLTSLPTSPVDAKTQLQRLTNKWSSASSQGGGSHIQTLSSAESDYVYMHSADENGKCYQNVPSPSTTQYVNGYQQRFSSLRKNTFKNGALVLDKGEKTTLSATNQEVSNAVK